MRPWIDLRFRPSLLIFVDEVGPRICEQFKAILQVAGLDRVLWPGIALLQCTAEIGRVVLLDRDTQSPGEERAIGQMVERALRDVQSSRRIGEIISAGYPVPNPRTQIYIVGDAEQQQTAKVYRLVQEQLTRMDYHTLVCCVLHTDRVRREIAEDPALERLSTESSPRSLTGRGSFCYLYEERLSSPLPTFISRAESCYAAAEALFALIATGLTTEPFFEEAVRGGTGPAAHASLGSLGASLILCPQAALLEYCSVRLSSEMVDRWLRDVREARLSQARQREVQASARNLVRSLESEIQDTRERPLANEARRLKGDPLTCMAGRAEPDLSSLMRALAAPPAGEPALSQEPPDLYLQLYGRSRALFALFWPRQTRRDYKRQRVRNASWKMFFSQRTELAVAAYAEWDTAATRAWNATTQYICAELHNFIEKLCAEEECGLRLATLSIDEIEERLADLRANLHLWHRVHVREYQAALRFLEELADGPWVSDPEGSQLLDRPAGENEQLVPVEQASLEDEWAASPASSEPHAEYISSLGPLSPQISDQEKRIIQHLEQHIDWRQRRVPSGPAQLIAAVPFVIAVLLTLFSFSWAPQTAGALAIVCAVVIGLVVTGYGLLYGKRAWEVRQAREDLLAFYRRYYAYLCEQREDRLRLLLLNVVQSKALCLRQRLDHMTGFLTEMHTLLAEQAAAISRELFQGPAGSRDVFIANGEILRQGQRNTLDDVIEYVAKQRALAPVAPWHATTQSLQRQFVEEMGERLFILSREEVQRHLLVYSREVMRSYCQGPLVDISAAMDKPDVWREALERAGQVLYQAPVGAQMPQSLFVCGRDIDVQKGEPYLPGDVYPVRISGMHAWVLAAAFSRCSACSGPYME